MSKKIKNIEQKSHVPIFFCLEDTAIWNAPHCIIWGPLLNVLFLTHKLCIIPQSIIILLHLGE